MFKPKSCEKEIEEAMDKTIVEVYGQNENIKLKKHIEAIGYLAEAARFFKKAGEEKKAKLVLDYLNKIAEKKEEEDEEEIWED